MEVDVSVDEGSTIITATFPPKPSLRASDLELTPPPSQRARSEAEQSEDNSEYDYDTDRTVYEDADDAPFTGEFETIIEWVANRKEGAPKMRLPESQEVDGTLYLNEDPNTEEMVFRVRFFGPSRGESISKAEAARRLAIEEEEYHSGSRVEAVGTWWQEVEETEEGF